MLSSVLRSPRAGQMNIEICARSSGSGRCSWPTRSSRRSSTHSNGGTTPSSASYSTPFANCWAPPAVTKTRIGFRTGDDGGGGGPPSREDRIGRMGFYVANGLGASIRSPSVQQMREFLRDIDPTDEEHGAAWLSTEVGYTLEWNVDRRLVFQRPGDNASRHLRSVSRDGALELWMALASGNLADVEQCAWQPGNGFVATPGRAAEMRALHGSTGRIARSTRSSATNARAFPVERRAAREEPSSTACCVACTSSSRSRSGRARSTIEHASPRPPEERVALLEELAVRTLGARGGDEERPAGDRLQAMAEHRAVDSSRMLRRISMRRSGRMPRMVRSKAAWCRRQKEPRWPIYFGAVVRLPTRAT